MIQIPHLHHLLLAVAMVTTMVALQVCRIGVVISSLRATDRSQVSIGPYYLGIGSELLTSSNI